MRRLVMFLAATAALAIVVVPGAAAMRFTDASYFPPDGVVGTPYPKFAFEISPGGGCPPYHYTITSGQFPPGLTLTLEGELAGQVTGTPTQAGTFSFWITVLDSAPGNCGNPPTRPPADTEREFTITVREGLNIAQQSLPAAPVNAPYQQQLTATGGGTQTWSLDSGTLPPGITLSPGGLLSGTPTTIGSYGFVVKVVDISGNRTTSKSLSINVVAPLTAAAPAVPPKAEVTSPFSTAVTAAGGTAPYTFAVTQGALPEGLKLDSATGKVDGVPVVPGPSSTVVTVTDANGFTATVPLSIDVAAKVKVATKRLGPARVGRLYRAKLQTLGGVAPYRWRLVGRLPVGIHFSTITGTFTGKARRAGSYRVTVRVVDRLGLASTQTLVLRVLAY